MWVKMSQYKLYVIVIKHSLYSANFTEFLSALTVGYDKGVLDSS